MMINLKDKILPVLARGASLDSISIRPIQDDYDLWFATVECELHPEQKDLVNPAGFSIGRAFLHPETNIPCIIWKNDTRIGYIVFRQWQGAAANSWSYYIDKTYQRKGHGTIASKLAIVILKSADPVMPIKLAVERANTKAQRIYTSIGFCHKGEMDGDDLVFEYEGE